MQLQLFGLLLAIFLVSVEAAGYDYAAPHLEYGAPQLKYAAPQQEYSAAQAADSISQYHTQDEYGQYAYGYTAPLYSKHETRTADGVTRGTYSYTDASGQLQTVDYIADASGFRVLNLPSAAQLQPNEETPEVATLRAQHLAAHAQVKLRLAGETVNDINLPQPVQDTPEVAAAKIAFFKRYEAEKLRHKLISENQQQKQSLPTSRTVVSPPIYVKTSLPIGFVYNYNPGPAKPARDYLPVA